MSNKLVYKEPRESRAIGGGIGLLFGLAALFFTSLVALESFTQNPVVLSLLLIIEVGAIGFALYFLVCIPILEIETSDRSINTSVSCPLFKKQNKISFSDIRTVGIKEAYYAGDHTEASGSFYFVELRGSANLHVPGTKCTRIGDANFLANELAQHLKVSFDAKPRKVFTGSFRIK